MGRCEDNPDGSIKLPLRAAGGRQRFAHRYDLAIKRRIRLLAPAPFDRGPVSTAPKPICLDQPLRRALRVRVVYGHEIA